MQQTTKAIIFMLLWLCGIAILTHAVNIDNCNHALQSMKTLNTNYTLDRMDTTQYNDSFEEHESYYNEQCKTPSIT